MELTIDGLKDLMITRLDLDMEPGEIATDSSFQDDLGLDSVDLLELAIGIERTYGVKITQNDTAAFLSLQSLFDYCSARSLAASRSLADAK